MTNFVKVPKRPIPSRMTIQYVASPVCNYTVIIRIVNNYRTNFRHTNTSTNKYKEYIHKHTHTHTHTHKRLNKDTQAQSCILLITQN